MKRRIDQRWGYAFVLVPGRGWLREPHYVWEQHGNAPVPKGYVLHHKDENKLNNAYENLELLSRSAHARLHGKSRTISEETRQKMRAGAARRVSDPEHRKMLSERAKAQHARGNLGKHSEETLSRMSSAMKQAWAEGKMNRVAQANRERAAGTSSEEMSRRSYQRKIFKP